MVAENTGWSSSTEAVLFKLCEAFCTFYWVMLSLRAEEIRLSGLLT